jgi:hypothetical protein
LTVAAAGTNGVAKKGRYRLKAKDAKVDLQLGWLQHHGSGGERKRMPGTCLITLHIFVLDLLI